MKKEWLIAIGATLLSLLVARSIVKTLRINSNVPKDMAIVQLDAREAPFYEGVFKRPSEHGQDLLISDPKTILRGAPFFKDQLGAGPHDVLGFRNRVVPTIADVVTIGDSQTYGNNVITAENWPSVMAKSLAGEVTVYNVSLGSWGGVQYFDMAQKVALFKPLAIVVAFYTGNDSLETFKAAYAVDSWKEFRLDASLSIHDMPNIPFPPPKEDRWELRFSSGFTTTFTPKLRLLSNDSASGAVVAGYRIIKEIATRIYSVLTKEGVDVYFTVIPTKEMVYSKRVQDEGVVPPEAYAKLIREEGNALSELTEHFAVIGAKSIDVVSDLKSAASTDALLYPPDSNGHPVPEGYRLIGETIARAVKDGLANKTGVLADGGYFTASPERYYVARKGEMYLFAQPEAAALSGWKKEDFVKVDNRRIESIGMNGVVRSGDTERFGPSKNTVP